LSSKILLVEDDRSIATVITAALEDEGFVLHYCESIAARDRLLSEHSFDAMLTDVMLGDGDGIASLDSARAIDPDMPVIVISAQNTLDTAVRASEHSAFEYLPKPFDLDELVRAVRQAAGQRSGAEPLPVSEGDGMPLVGRSPAMQASTA